MMTDPRDLIKRLADALHEAAGEVEGWGNYASSYFQEKHDLRGNVARIYAEAAEAYAYLDQPEPEEEEWYSRFGDWLEREMPEGTVIGDPLWWASKIADYLLLCKHQ